MWKNNTGWWWWKIIRFLSLWAYSRRLLYVNFPGTSVLLAKFSIFWHVSLLSQRHRINLQCKYFNAIQMIFALSVLSHSHKTEERQLKTSIFSWRNDGRAGLHIGFATDKPLAIRANSSPVPLTCHLWTHKWKALRIRQKHKSCLL